MNADGSYTYVANQDAANELDASDTVTDVFNYTLSDGTATDTATITITITGVNDAPSGVNDTGYINEDATLTVADGGSAVAGTASEACIYSCAYMGREAPLYKLRSKYMPQKQQQQHLCLTVMLNPSLNPSPLTPV